MTCSRNIVRRISVFIVDLRQRMKIEGWNYGHDIQAYIQGVPKNVPGLCGCCGGDINSIISSFTQLHRSGFNLEFETLYESI